MSDPGQDFGQGDAGGTPPPPSGPAGAPPPDAGYAPPPDAGYGAPPPAQEYGAPQQGYAQPDMSQQGYAQPPAVQQMGASTSEDNNMALIAHVLALLTGVIGTGIFYAVSGERSAYVKHHVTEALNFSITVLIAWFATTILSFVLIGLLIIPFLFLWQLILPIMAIMAANKGEWYRYPATLRLVKGPMDQPGMA